MKYDFHIHTSFSDGSKTPEEIFQIAKKKGLYALSLTDHDSILGLAKADLLSKQLEIPFLPGAEFTAVQEGTKFHVLGYNLDYDSKELTDYSLHILSKLNEISRKQIHKLQNHGINLTEDSFFRRGQGGPLYRGKLLKTLSDHGLIEESNIMNLLPQYFDPDGICYVDDEIEYLNFSSIVRLIKRNGGIVILAHPAKLKKKNKSLYWRIVTSKLLDGIELYHPSLTNEILEDLIPIINNKKLLVTGGSDYHGLFQKKQIEIGDMQIPDRIIENLSPYFRHNRRKKE